MRFTKMQGAGNDFIVVNNLELGWNGEQLSKAAKRLCLRRLSIGGDALMAVDRPEGDGDFRMRFYNADGTEAEMCGNGARCIARFAYEHGIAGETMRIETVAGIVEAWRENKRQYRVRLNDPSVVRTDLKLDVSELSTSGPSASDPSVSKFLGSNFLEPENLGSDEMVISCAYVELGEPGIPHAVVKYEGITPLNQLSTEEEDSLRQLGRALRRHPQFPKGANVNFYQVIGDNRLLAKTFERGVEDFTLACGTGAGSTALALMIRGEVAGPRVKLTVPGGELFVEVEDQEPSGRFKRLYLIGDTNLVAEGEALDEDF